MTYSQPFHEPRQPIGVCSALHLNWRDGWFWLLGWVSHGECTNMYGYTLDRTYVESWHKIIKWSWLYQAFSLCCLSNLWEYRAYAKVSSSFDWPMGEIVSWSYILYGLSNYWWKIVAMSILNKDTMTSHKIETEWMILRRCVHINYGHGSSLSGTWHIILES